MTKFQGVTSTFLLAGPLLCLSVESGISGDEPTLSNQVKSINWKRFRESPPRNQHRELSGRILLNSTRWGSDWIEKQYRLSTEKDRYLVPNQNNEHVIRPGCSVAAGLAVAIKTGLVKANPEAVPVDERELTKRTVRLIKGLAAIHKANGGKWGDHWQSSLWSALLGRAAWMLWESLDNEAREMVCRLIEYEADRHTREGYRVPYWNGKGGDSKAEENAWESMVLQQAIIMMPRHPNVIRWKKVCSELMTSTNARKSDMVRTEPLLDGKPPKDWLRGFNVTEDGIIINHNRIHNDYMCAIALQMQAFLLCSLADVPVPQATDFNFEVVYQALVTKRFESPPFKKPGGTMYIPGKPGQYYPEGTDWSIHRFACFYWLDAYAHVLGYDMTLPHKAREWMELRGRKILEMQSRHEDGRMYARGEFDTYAGREQYVLWVLSDAYLLQWLADQKALSSKGNWLEGGSVRQGDDALLWQKAKAAVKAAIPQAEKDPTRPVYHFRPPAQWMNDICGAIYHKGYYHAFYAYHPFSGNTWGVDNSIWAHARSKDLVYWEDLPWAVLPMKNRGEKRCNSGCVTLDGNGKPTIFYTFVPNKGKRHQWGLKPLDDDLIQWKRVSNAPLMAAGKNGIPLDVNDGWSDPFVFKSERRTFVTFKSCGGLVCEAKDRELTQWEYAGKLEGVTGECPNFFPLQDKWVLIRSTHPISYVVGDFDAKTIAFRASGSAATMDYGFGKNPPKDRSWTRGLYGTNAFEDEKGRRILLGWICGFKPKRGWNGCMSLPRILTLDKDQRLIQSPAPELRILRGRHRAVRELKLNNKEEQLKGIAGDTMEILAEFEAGDAGTFGLKVRQSQDGKNAVTIRYTNGKLNVAGTDVPLKLPAGKLRLHVFVDKSVLEVFINDGVTSVTRVNYPGENDLGVSVFAGNGNATLKSLDAWEMKSMW